MLGPKHSVTPFLQNKKSPGAITEAQAKDVVSREEGRHSPCLQVGTQAA